MKKTIMYEYLGTNGTILSPVHLEDIYYIRKYKLQADNLKKLTKDNEHFVKEVIVPGDEVEEWKEI